jgi:DNA-directed RNA polymerase subunit RPC12/RpoP
MKNRIRNVWRQFKELFQKKDAKDMAIFHCSDCGNDFEDQRNIADYDLNTDNLTLITKYSYRKCPKCGNWSSTQNTIEQL